MEEPASSGESGDESGSDQECSNVEKQLQNHVEKQIQNHREWNSAHDRGQSSREQPPDQPSTSSANQEPETAPPPSLPRILPKIDLPGGAMLYPSGVLAGVGLDGIGTNLGLGNLAMGYPHSFILGLANQGQDGASSSNQPQFITIPLSMMAGANPAQNGCPSASSDDSSELQDLSTGNRK
ncbi:unnamed protein product [Leptidea sinapis]|uniref:Uncharacterized protein n=1 Tax=Leptidea sinapis TaxID=189913 RepID=A0A5E4QL07_9NEOP|nr:unnamed protein product [Leptidea sinapis]